MDANVKKNAAALILRTAREMTSGKFGDDKVFVSHLYRALWANESGFVDVLADFKGALLMLHCDRYLTLCRADLVEAMDQTDVAESEITHHNATFHFLKL